MVAFISTASLILIALLLFGLLIAFHEFGHMIVAKILHVPVEEFSVGIGPAILKKQIRETDYSLRILPVGGYCKFHSDNKSTIDAVPWKRILILVAGGAANILLGILLIFIVVVQQSQYSSTIIESIDSESPLIEQGVSPDERILSVNGYSTFNVRDIVFSINRAEDYRITLRTDRNGSAANYEGIQFRISRDQNGNVAPIIDFTLKSEGRTFQTVMSHTFSNTYSYIRMTYYSLFDIISGKSGISGLSGPIGTASVITSVVTQNHGMDYIASLNNIFLLLSIISINLGIINLLPLPALDGGRLVFVLLEIIFRRPVNPKIESTVHSIGFILLGALIVLISVFDIMRIF